MKIAAFTVAVLDYFPHINKYFPGGNALNQAIHFREMGVEAAAVGAVGTDEAGDILLKIMEQKDLIASHMHQIEGQTASNQLRIDDQGERFGIDGAWNGGVYESFRLSEDDWSFLNGFEIWATHANCPDFEQTIKRKKSSHFLAVDFLHLDDYNLLENHIDKIDIAYFGGTREMQEPLSALARKHQALIVLTLGAEGAIAFQGNNVFMQKALPIGKVIDTTGCGDAFQAGFTLECIRSKDIQASLLKGAERGKLTAGHYGAIQF